MKHAAIGGAVLAAFAILLAAGAALAEMPADLAKMRDQILMPTVQLNDNCSGQIIYSKRAQETGKVSTYILTAKHCLKGMDGKDITVSVPTYNKATSLTGEAIYYAAIEAQSYASDIALLRLLDTDAFFPRVVHLAPIAVDLYEAEPVWTAGYPQGLARTITSGLLSMGVRINIDGMGLREYLKATPDAAPGSSGGGLYHKSPAGDFELIGTTTGMFGGFSFLIAYTPIIEAQKFLKAQVPMLFKELYGDAKIP